MARRSSRMALELIAVLIGSIGLGMVVGGLISGIAAVSRARAGNCAPERCDATFYWGQAISIAVVTATCLFLVALALWLISQARREK